jgi:tetratricopeptide (TPR) repeat protein
MDLLHFDAQDMYFDDALSPEVEGLLRRAAQTYGKASAEHSLLEAYFLEPEHLMVLVALYRYFYYRHRYADALRVAERAVAVAARRLGLAADWRRITSDDFGRAILVSMTQTRFLPLALKGAGYLKLRLSDPQGALDCLEKVAAFDANDRLATRELIMLARTRVAEEQARRAGAKVATVIP